MRRARKSTVIFHLEACPCRCGCRSPGLDRYTRFLCSRCWGEFVGGREMHGPTLSAGAVSFGHDRAKT